MFKDDCRRRVDSGISCLSASVIDEDLLIPA